MAICTIPPFLIDEPEHKDLKFLNYKILGLRSAGEMADTNIVSYSVEL